MAVCECLLAALGCMWILWGTAEFKIGLSQVKMEKGHSERMSGSGEPKEMIGNEGGRGIGEGLRREVGAVIA